MKRTPSSFNWVFTLNNPSSNDIPSHWPYVLYLIWQRESASTPHLQGYAIFTKRLRLSSLKEVDKTAHWEPRRGTHAQARNYASKSDTRVEGPWIIGTEPIQGKRTDLLEVKSAIESGYSEEQVLNEFYPLWVRYRHSFQAHRLLLRQKITRPRPEILVVYGPTGTGKTRSVREAFPKAYWLDAPIRGGNLWFDGYDGESTIVIDEFFGWISYTEIKRLLDFGRVKVKVHGGVVSLLAHRFIFTSNKHPRSWYKNDIGGAFERRLKEFGELLFIDKDTWRWEAWEAFFQSNVTKNRYHPYQLYPNPGRAPACWVGL